MKYRKFTKNEKKQVQAENLANALHGEGLYLFENKSQTSEITLPRPTRSGRRAVGPKEQFQGDNYYMQMVRSGELRLIKELQSPAQEREAMEQKEEKLILDQPETVTNKGKVEQVVDKETPEQKLHEGDNDQQKDVLLNESPDGFVIVED